MPCRALIGKYIAEPRSIIGRDIDITVHIGMSITPFVHLPKADATLKIMETMPTAESGKWHGQ